MTSDSNASFLERVYYYDGRGRCVQCKELYPGGSWHRVSTKYAYTSEVTVLADDCYVNGVALDSTFTYSYDSRGRKTSLDVSHGGKTARISYNYDNLGRLVSTILGSNAVATVVDSYTVQGWLKQRTSSQFSSFLYYDAPLHSSVTSAPGLAGNITEWRMVRGSQTSSLAFSYDKMSRLTGASRFNGTSNVSLLVNIEKDITYDANGNITTLKRYGAAGSSPQQLSFSYDGNKRIADSYDQYGNLTADSTAGTSLAWNIAGMPRTITTGSTVGRYSFAADGSKYKLSDGSTELIYMGSMVIRKQNNVTSLDILNFGDGVIRKNGNDLEVNYYIKDHLGSIRTVLNASGTILSQHDYYPFGKEITASGSNAASQRYTFSGKENQATTPAQAPYLDFGARMYSADSLRWLSHDPLAEKYYSVTPYSYCAGNPVNLVDPDGEDFKYSFNPIKGTLTIEAIYYYETKQDEISLQQALDFWNGKKDCTYTDSETGKEYIVIFNLTKAKVTKLDNFNNQNTYTVSDKELEDTQTGSSNDPDENGTHNQITVRPSYSVNQPNGKISTTGAHEIGHTLGMEHSETGIMTRSQDSHRSDKVLDKNIKEMITSPEGRESTISKVLRFIFR